TETQVRERQHIRTSLPQPHARSGYYRDAFVLAYPSLPIENGLMKDQELRVFLDGREVDRAFLFDGNVETKIRIEPKEDSKSNLTFVFAEPFTAQSITITRQSELPKDLFDGPRDYPPSFDLLISDNGQDYRKIATIRMGAMRSMVTPGMQNFDTTSARFYRLETSDPAWVSGVELHSGPRLAGWPGKTDCTGGTSSGYQPDMANDQCIDPDAVIDVTSYMDSEGILEWRAPSKGNWSIVRIGHTTTGEEVMAHPESGKGLETDKFSRAALDFHHKCFTRPLVERLRPYIGKTFVGFATDSWESGKQNWSVGLPQEFEKRRQYSLTPWLLCMTGRIVGSVDQTERFLWDMRKTSTELVSENYYAYWQEWCHGHGLQYHAENHGHGNLDHFEIGQHLDVPMAEFTAYLWAPGVDQARSLGHLYGKNIIAAEAYTGMPASTKWTEYPYSMKAQGDEIFTMGMNRLVFHTFVHQPYEHGIPGMTMGPFGVHFDRTNTITDHTNGWTEYLRRVQYLLQQGLPVIDTCWYKGDDPHAGMPNLQSLPKGFQGDALGPDALFGRLSIENGNIVLPDGMTYRLFVLPDLKSLEPRTLQRISQLVEQGMKLLVYGKPEHSHGLLAADEDMKAVGDRLYGPLDGITQRRRRFGKGELFWGVPIEDVLAALSVAPDFLYSSENADAHLQYTHRTVDGAEVYFVANRRRRFENVVCSFRGHTMPPEVWHPETGEIVTPACYSFSNGRVQMPLILAPAESTFVVFRNPERQLFVTKVTHDGSVLYADQGFEQADAAKSEVCDNFSISLWAKPDTYAYPGRSMLFHSTDGERLFDSGHVICGMAAGRNGLRAYEGRNTVVECDVPVEGWSHIVLNYEDKVPSLFVNAKLITKGKRSGSIVHPGVEMPGAIAQTGSHFEGNMTRPQLFSRFLSPLKIRELYERGLPEPPDLPPARFVVEKGAVRGLFTQNGVYELFTSSDNTKVVTIEHCGVKKAARPWTVRFPLGSGAPEQIALTRLISLRQHSDFNVKHFAGTAAYHTRLEISPRDFVPGRRFLLDLGRVEVIARV
ncbi:MAG: hypothetical protein JSW27_02285, partial [Phycisphaerales bacterium]